MSVSLEINPGSFLLPLLLKIVLAPPYCINLLFRTLARSAQKSNADRVVTLPAFFLEPGGVLIIPL